MGEHLKVGDKRLSAKEPLEVSLVPLSPILFPESVIALLSLAPTKKGAKIGPPSIEDRFGFGKSGPHFFRKMGESCRKRIEIELIFQGKEGFMEA
ncbi:MAG: hypothetical protein WCF19_07105 [Chlamydiales bacterium]